MRLSKLLLPVAAAAVAGLPAAQAHATGYTAKDVWDVSAKVTQKTTWSYNHTESGTCDADQAGHGTETVTLRSKRAVRATTYQGGYPMFLAGKKGFSLPLKGAVTRDGAVATGQSSSPAGSCPDGVGGPPPQSDCGTKAIPRAFLEPTYDTRGKRIHLAESATPLVPTFANCPILGGTAWPSLLLSIDGRDVAETLPFKELPDAGKHILIGRGSQKGGDGESIWRTTIRWELTLKRVEHEAL